MILKMPVSKLSERVTPKLSERASTLAERQRSPLSVYRQTRQEIKAFSKYESSLDKYKKELSEYQDAITSWENVEKEQLDYQQSLGQLQSNLEQLKTVLSKGKKPVEEIGQFKKELSKGEESLMEIHGVKRAYKAYESAFGEYEKERTDYLESIQDWKKEETREKERKEYVESYEKLKGKTETYATKMSKEDTDYENVLASVQDITSEKETLLTEEEDTKQIMEGNIILSPLQKEQYTSLSAEFSKFQTYPSLGTRLISKAPSKYKAAYARGYGWIEAPYLTGEFKEFSPETFEVTKKKATVTGWKKRTTSFYETEFPVVKEEVLGKSLLGEGMARKVKFKLITENLSKLAPKESYSQLAAKTLKQNYAHKQAKKQEKEFKDMFHSNKKSFTIVNPFKQGKAIRSNLFY